MQRSRQFVRAQARVCAGGGHGNVKELLKAYRRVKVSRFEQLLEVIAKPEEHMLSVVKKFSTPLVAEGESSAAALTSLLQDRYCKALS